MRRSRLRTTARAWPGRFVIGCVLALAAAAAHPALADVSTVNRVTAPIVRVNVGQGDVTIRTWDREDVEVDGDSSLLITRRVVRPRGENRSVLIPGAQAQTARGLVQLPPESFVVSSIPAGPRDLVVVRSTSPVGVGAVTVHVPADSVFIYAHAARGNLDVHDYKAGTLIGFVGHGRLSLDNVGGTVFTQTNRGALVAQDSNFERIRARSLVANMAFERCNVRQIEATSVAGSIVYDAGSFQPGLARFESTSGNVAIGTSGVAQLGARTTGGGRVFTDFAGAARVDAHDNAASATVGGGGPVVTATSESGNVYLYNGSLHSRPSLPLPWRAAAQALDRPEERVRTAAPDRVFDRGVFGTPGPQRSAFPVPRRTVLQPHYRAPAPTARRTPVVPSTRPAAPRARHHVF